MSAFLVYAAMQCYDDCTRAKTPPGSPAVPEGNSMPAQLTPAVPVQDAARPASGPAFPPVAYGQPQILIPAQASVSNPLSRARISAVPLRYVVPPRPR